MSLLSLLLIVPATGALLVAVLGPFRARAKSVALFFSAATLVVAFMVWARFDFSDSGYQLVESFTWMAGLGASYLIGVDAVSLILLAMTTLLTPFSILASRGEVPRGKRAFFSSLLFFEASVIGAFLAIDVLLFYMFWMLALVALFLLMGLWGGEHRRRASLTFGLLTAGGGLVMLLVILVCYHTHFLQSGSPSFDTRHWEGLVLTPAAETWLFWGLFLAFAVQTPLFPFHFWLSGTAQESPTAGRVLASVVLLKIGAYGLFRFAVPWFPRAAWTYAPTVMTLAVVSLLVGGVAALVSNDARKLLARVTVAHMALVVLGIFSFVAAGVKGALVLALAHSFFMGAMYLMIEMVRDRVGSPLIEDFRGPGGIMPVGWVITLLLSAAALGIPVFHGIEILSGVMIREPVQAVVAGVGLAVLAVVFLRVVRKTLGKTEHGKKKDLRGRELLILAPLVLLVIWIGIAPGGVLRSLDPVARAFVSRVSDQVVLTE